MMNQYSYNMNFAIYTENVDGNIIKSDINELMKDMIADFMMKPRKALIFVHLPVNCGVKLPVILQATERLPPMT